MDNVFNSLFDWLYGLNPVVAVVILILAVFLKLFGKQIIFALLKDKIGQKYATIAVEAAEQFVHYFGEEKFLLAARYLNNELKKRFKMSLPDDWIEKMVQWGYDKMIAEGRDIKAEDVLKTSKESFRIDVKHLELVPSENKEKLEIGYKPQFKK